MKRLGLNGRAVVLAAVVLIPLALTLWLLTVAGQDLRTATNDRRDANQRGILITQAGLRVVDIETALRGFSQSGDSRFLDPRDKAVRIIPQIERRLRLLLERADTQTVQRIRAFIAQVDAYIREYADPLLADLRRRAPDARSTARTLEGKQRVDAIRARFNSLVAREQSRADHSTARANASADRSNLIGIIGLISLPLLVILAALIVSRELRRSRSDLGRATAEAQDAAETNRALLEASNDGFVAVDEGGVVIAYTEQAERIYGYPADQVIGHVLADVVLPADGRDSHHDRRRALFASGSRMAPYRVWIEQPSGRRVLIELTAAPATTSTRRMGVYFVRDVTVETLREQERLAEEAVSRVLVQADSGDDPIGPIIAAMGKPLLCLHGTFWQHDEQENAVRCTETWAAEGFKAPDLQRRLREQRHLLGTPIDPRAPVGVVWETGREHWAPFSQTAVAADVDPSETQEIRGVFALPVSAGGELLGVLAFGTADTEPPGELRWAALRSMADLVGQVLGRHRAEREAERLTHEFFALVSHELRTPLTSLIGYLDMVRDEEIGELNDDQAQYLLVVDRSAHRLMRLVGDLLFVAQVETGRLPLDLAPTELRTVVLDAVESARVPAEQAGVTVTSEAEAVRIPLGDTDRLAQLVDNLVSNAIKFTPSGGSITVALHRVGDEAVLEVRDTGPGISPEDQKHLFERFFRAEHAHRDAIAGLGLGLSICLAIVDAHHGTLSVEGAPGGGTVARATFPLTPA